MNEKAEKSVPCICINKGINDNITKIKNDFGYSSDLEVNNLRFDNNKDIICASIYISSLVDKSTMNNLSLELAKLEYECSHAKPDINLDALINFFFQISKFKTRFRL